MGRGRAEEGGMVGMVGIVGKVGKVGMVGENFLYDTQFSFSKIMKRFEEIFFICKTLYSNSFTCLTYCFLQALIRHF